METGKKQADSAAELDAEVAKLKAQEQEYEQTIAQLTKDFSALERENAKLKQAVSAAKNGRTSGSLDTPQRLLNRLSAQPTIWIPKDSRSSLGLWKLQTWWSR